MNSDFEHNPFSPNLLEKSKENPVSSSKPLNNFQPFNSSQSMISPDKKVDNVAEELERRQKELDAKAEQLARKEADQNRIAQEQASQQNSSERKKNFPPLPKFFPCAPCFYIKIEQEIPENHRILVNYGFRLWLAYSILTIINFLAAITYLAGSENKSSGGTLLGTALFGLITIPPLSFLFWFLPLYKAFKSDSSINFFIFFAIMTCQIIVMALQFVGVPNFGVCGLGYLFSITAVPWLFVIVCLITTGYGCVTGFSIYLFKRVHHSFRHSDANFNKAKSELFTNITSDPSIRNAAVNLVAGNNQNNNNSQGDNRPSHSQNLA